MHILVRVLPLALAVVVTVVAIVIVIGQPAAGPTASSTIRRPIAFVALPFRLLVSPHVPMHIPVGRERQIAVLAIERPLTGVDQHVPVQRRRRREHLGADFAHKLPVPVVAGRSGFAVVVRPDVLREVMLGHGDCFADWANIALAVTVRRRFVVVVLYVGRGSRCRRRQLLLQQAGGAAVIVVVVQALELPPQQLVQVLAAGVVSCLEQHRMLRGLIFVRVDVVRIGAGRMLLLLVERMVGLLESFAQEMVRMVVRLVVMVVQEGVVRIGAAAAVVGRPV